MAENGSRTKRRTPMSQQEAWRARCCATFARSSDPERAGWRRACTVSRLREVLYKRAGPRFTIFLVVLGSVTRLYLHGSDSSRPGRLLIVEAREQNVVSFNGGAATATRTGRRPPTIIRRSKSLQSRALRRRTLTDLQLWDNTPFGRTGGEGGVEETMLSAPGAGRAIRVSALRGTRWSARHRALLATPHGFRADETAAQSRAVECFRQNTSRRFRKAAGELRYERPEEAGLVRRVSSTTSTATNASRVSSSKFMARKRSEARTAGTNASGSQLEKARGVPNGQVFATVPRAERALS